MQATALSRILAEKRRKENAVFKPDPSFYERVNINRIRFWQLVKGKKKPYTDEAKALSEYFGVSINEFFEE
jgi:hypothetical protein